MGKGFTRNDMRNQKLLKLSPFRLKNFTLWKKRIPEKTLKKEDVVIVDDSVHQSPW